tara:strand:- start:58 stop:777 length:720 start_codon:yes stop_codon:yes gene_type:complete
MREFNIIQHGAGKNFLGAIQQVIRGKETVINIEKQIKINNLFDGIYTPFNFNPNWYDRTTWNKELLECHTIWRQALAKKYSKPKAKKDIIDRLNTCYKGTFHLNFTVPGIPHYGILCILDSPEQRAELDQLAFAKKKSNKYFDKSNWDKTTIPDKNFKKDRIKETNLIHSWEIENMNSYKADYTYDYTSLFHELDPRLITEIVERTEEAFKVESPVTIADVTTLIAKYNRRNHEILNNE